MPTPSPKRSPTSTRVIDRPATTWFSSAGSSVNASRQIERDGASARTTALGEQLRFRHGVTLGAPDRVREREHFYQYEPVDDVYVVHVDLLRMSLERGVDVFVDEQHHIRLFHPNHVVAVQGLARVAASQFLVQGEQ